jgi:hypothetical protein
MDTPDLDRLTLLERAQQLHDSTLRRHGDMLDRHEDQLIEHAVRMARLEDLLAQQQRLQGDLREIADRLTQQQAVQAARQDRHEETMASLAQTLAAIKDMLDRGNGH